MNCDKVDMFFHCLLIEGSQAKVCAYGIFDLLLWNRWRMFAKLLSVLHSIGTAPYHFARGACDTSVIAPTLPTSQKAAQYTLRVVPGGLSLISIFINIAALTLFALCHEKFIEVNDGADVALVGEQVTDHSLRPLGFAPW